MTSLRRLALALLALPALALFVAGALLWALIVICGEEEFGV